MTAIDEHPPYPRISHCHAGAVVQLRGESRLRTIELIAGGYAYFSGGRLAIGLSHRVNQVLRERDGHEWRDTQHQLMGFGEGGWRPLSTRSVHNPMDNPRTPDARPCNTGVVGCLVTELS